MSAKIVPLPQTDAVNTPPAPAVKLHDQVENWINEGGAGDEDTKSPKSKQTTATQAPASILKKP